jgi:hypothetical protein
MSFQNSAVIWDESNNYNMAHQNIRLCFDNCTSYPPGHAIFAQLGRILSISFRWSSSEASYFNQSSNDKYTSFFTPVQRWWSDLDLKDLNRFYGDCRVPYPFAEESHYTYSMPSVYDKTGVPLMTLYSWREQVRANAE